MSFENQCPQCVFVTQQLGQRTACLLHVTVAADTTPAVSAEDYDEPYTLGQRLTVDRIGPFTLREYVRLQLLRSRLEANRSKLDRAAPSARSVSVAHL